MNALPGSNPELTLEDRFMQAFSALFLTAVPMP